MRKLRRETDRRHRFSDFLAVFVICFMATLMLVAAARGDVAGELLNLPAGGTWHLGPDEVGDTVSVSLTYAATDRVIVSNFDTSDGFELAVSAGARCRRTFCRNVLVLKVHTVAGLETLKRPVRGGRHFVSIEINPKLIAISVDGVTEERLTARPLPASNQPLEFGRGGSSRLILTNVLVE